MKTTEEEVQKLKREHQQFSDALEYLERSLPNGIQIVAAALANIPRDECPAIVALWGGDDSYGW